MMRYRSLRCLFVTLTVLLSSNEISFAEGAIRVPGSACNFHGGGAPSD